MTRGKLKRGQDLYEIKKITYFLYEIKYVASENKKKITFKLEQLR